MRHFHIRRWSKRFRRAAIYFHALARHHIWDSVYHFELTAYAGAVGNVVMVWASIEMQLDFINLIIITHALPKKKRDTPIPVSLNQKIAFFKRSFETLPQLSSLRADALALIGKVDELKLDRHGLVHGFPTRFFPLGKTEAIRVKYIGSQLRYYRKTWRYLDILKTSELMNALNGELHGFLRVAHARFHHPDDVAG